jgi:hypothetical protein
LTGDVERVAGENSRTVRTDGVDAGWSDDPPPLVPSGLSFGEASPLFQSRTRAAQAARCRPEGLRYKRPPSPDEDDGNPDQNENEALHCDS